MTQPLAFLATCDLVAQVRGRALESEALIENGKSCGWVPADSSLTSLGFIADPEPFGAFGDIRVVPIPETKVIFESSQENRSTLDFYLTHILNPDGSLWQCDPRSTLERALSRLHNEFGLELYASFEHEFTLSGPDLAVGKPFGFDSFRKVESFGNQLFYEAKAMGLEPENWLPEYGAGQFEITLQPAPALIAADRAIILRELVRDLAHRSGLSASFVPIPNLSSVGNGVHIHLSLWRDSEPVTFDEGKPGNLSEQMAQSCAGILHHMNSVLTWSAPSQISFLRLKPHKWSAGIKEIAVQNREAVLRICPVNRIFQADPRQSFNVEFRAADATANPWLALTALVQAMISGLVRGENPSRVLDGPLEDREDLDLLPHSLDLAIEGFLADPVAQKWFDPLLVAAHLAIRNSEKLALHNLTDDEKCRRYADVY